MMEDIKAKILAELQAQFGEGFSKDVRATGDT